VKKSLITIITCTYNSEKTIADCVRSVKNQSYKNIEHLIIDGQSKDSTLEIIQDVNDRCKIISEIDNGIYDAFNKGILSASGEIIGFLHSDDVFKNNDCVKLILDSFNDDIDGVYGNLNYVSQFNLNKIIRKWNTCDFNYSLLRKGWMPPHPSLFLKKKVYDKHGLFNLKYFISADYDFIIRIFKDKNLKFMHLPSVMIQMRLGGSSNKSLQNLIKKMREDYSIIKSNEIGGFFTLFNKNFSKIKQFFWYQTSIFSRKLIENKVESFYIYKMKGIILAGGSGSRLFPITKGTSKQLLSIYDKPMIYYPLSVLMLAGIKDILIISNPDNLQNFKKLFNNGNDLGLKIAYKEQKNPDGIAQAFYIGKDFIKNDDVCLVLGDNIFYGKGFTGLLNSAKSNLKNNKATVFGYNVNNPSDFGIASFDNNKNLIKIEEKPTSPKSNTAVVGLYFYPNSVVNVANKIKPSKRGEYEISSVNQCYLEKKELKIEILGRGFTWLDTGTHDSLLEASNFIKTVENHSGYKVACLEEIAFKMKFISLKKLKALTKPFGNSSYGKYLKSLVNENQ